MVCRFLGKYIFSFGASVMAQPSVKKKKSLPAMQEMQEIVGSIPGSGRSPGGGNGNLLSYSCLKSPMDRGTWRVIVHGVTKSQI